MPFGPVAELVDAPDLKSVVPKGTCWFKSSRGHHHALGYVAKGDAGISPQ